jgi:hypothetical protein
MAPLGLIAGGGRLPVQIAESRRAEGQEVFVVRLKGAADPELAEFPGVDAGLAELGRTVKALRRAGCERVCFAGKVERLDPSTLKPDFAALKYLPGVAAAARQGDDALLRAILSVFESEGFKIEGVGEAGRALLLGAGPLGRLAAGPEHQADIALALAEARAAGEIDAGQGAVARDGVLLAAEGLDGTDAMLERLAPSDARRGVLAKIPKPNQDLRVDIPTIGVRTIENAARAGLAGIVGRAGDLLVVDKPAVIEAADRLGLFVVGVEDAAP